MKAADMTYGGFYNYFASKDDPALEVFRHGFSGSLTPLTGIREEHHGAARAAVPHVSDQYR